LILVQSEKCPDWSSLPKNYLLRPAECKPLNLAFALGQLLRFRLRANPTKKTGTTTKADRLAGLPRRNGQRVALLHENEQLDWLSRKEEQGGFRVLHVTVTPEGFVQSTKGADTDRLRLSLMGVRFDGLLSVTDPDRFLQTLCEGVGPAKGFGFGLLSLAHGED
jgi:CRISPR system Cascade subunit CasE